MSRRTPVGTEITLNGEGGRPGHRMPMWAIAARDDWVTAISRETLNDRWLTLITGPDQRGREGTSEVYDRLTSAVAELALRMVHGLRDNGREDERLVTLTYHVEQLVEREVKDFAMEVETERRARIDAAIVPDAAHSR